jgi:hypothetical protein
MSAENYKIEMGLMISKEKWFCDVRHVFNKFMFGFITELSSLLINFKRHSQKINDNWRAIFLLKETSVNFKILSQYGEVHDGGRDDMSNVDCLLKEVFRGE